MKEEFSPKRCAERYRENLCEDILPFWLKHGLDRENGGFYTCLDRTGKLMDRTKSVWFQGRAGYIFSLAYNEVEPNAAWLSAARSCLDFLEQHCFDSSGHAFFEVSQTGEGLRKRRYLFSESFAAIAFSEYARATGEREWAEKALEMFFRIQRFRKMPGYLPSKYEPCVKMKGLSLTMILLNVVSCIRKVISDPALELQAEESIKEILCDFMKPEYEALLECVGPRGEFIDTLAGRTINPGHSLETAWFILEEARYRNGDPALVKAALTILDWSWKWGWDDLYGGIINFRDCKHFPHQDYSQDMKFWWPQTEAVIATLYAWCVTGDEKYLTWYRRVHEWIYSHFPDAEYGEWFGYLHRDGSVAQDAKGNFFKGPFHIPRMMIKALELLKMKD